MVGENIWLSDCAAEKVDNLTPVQYSEVLHAMLDLLASCVDAKITVDTVIVLVGDECSMPHGRILFDLELLSPSILLIKDFWFDNEVD